MSALRLTSFYLFISVNKGSDSKRASQKTKIYRAADRWSLTLERPISGWFWNFASFKLLHVIDTLQTPFESKSLETQHNFPCIYVSSDCKMMNPACRLKCVDMLNIICVWIILASLSVMGGLQHRFYESTERWEKQIWGIFPPLAAGRMVTVQWHFKCCEKLFPEQLTAEFCFLQKAQENVVAFLKAQLHFRELLQKFCHCKVQLRDPSHLPLNISLVFLPISQGNLPFRSRPAHKL